MMQMTPTESHDNSTTPLHIDDQSARASHDA